jgi:hypothetical protein
VKEVADIDREDTKHPKNARLLELSTPEGIEQCIEEKWSLDAIAADVKDIELDERTLEVLQTSALIVIIRFVEAGDLLALRGADRLLEVLGATPLFDELPIVRLMNRFMKEPVEKWPPQVIPFKRFLDFFKVQGFSKLNASNLGAHVHEFFERLERLKG